MRVLVDLVEVGAFFAIHLDVDEMLVHHGGDRFILERFMRHHMTPVAGGIADGKQDGFVLLACDLQGLGIPRMPVHRVVGVLQQVGAGFVDEMVWHQRSNGSSDGRTLRRMAGCPAALGCRLSAWNCSGSMPCSMKGTSATLCRFASLGYSARNCLV